MLNILNKFLKFEATAGILLMAVTVVALIIANSPFYPVYETILYSPFSISQGAFELNKPLIFWINDGLMVIFFFLIGLEIKREFVEGHLSHGSQRILPGTATLGGILVPAFIYLLFNYDNETNIKGWAIPTATDIAFALGVLALIGKGIPKTLRIFLMTIAVLDDLSAVLIIAVFYAKGLSAISLILALFILMILIFLNIKKVKRISVYVALSLILWAFVLQSGVHATIAGVFAAFTIPLGKNTNTGKRPLVMMEQFLHPWVAYIILPVFAFANAGVQFKDISLSYLMNPIMLGIMLGLFFGKQIGIFCGILIPIKLGFGKLPNNISWLHIYGISVLCGIGFTMSLFIGTLAFEEGGPAYDNILRLGVLIASFCSFIWGYLVLKLLISASNKK